MSRLTKLPFHHFGDPAVFCLIDHPMARLYAARLAFFQRIRLPLEYCFEFIHPNDSFPIDDVPNFVELQRLCDLHYPTIFKTEATNEHQKQIVFAHITRLALRLWCAGYGVVRGFSEEPITGEVLERACQIVNRDRMDRRHPSIWFLYITARILAKDARSAIDKMPVLPGRQATSLFDAESEKWAALNIPDEQHSALHSLHKFVFSELLERVSHAQTRTVINSVRGRTYVTRRGGLGPLSPLTWLNYSTTLRLFAVWTSSNLVLSTEDLINVGISNFLKEQLSLNKRRGALNPFRAAAREWVRWYSDIHGLSLNPYRIVPKELRAKGIRYAPILDISAACLLIDTLLDNDTGLIDENDILAFRTRRVCLIALETGGRMGSVCLLFQNCIEKDHLGNHFLRFHRVKNGRPYCVPASENVLSWVAQLTKMGADEKIHVPTDRYHVGDGQTEFRLVANAANDGLLTTIYVDKFLSALQKKLWPASHPNGKPFTSRDFRRLRALYMLLSNKRREDIQQQLGHSSIDSQLPYIATGPPEVQRWFGEMLKEGIWKNVSTEKAGPTDIELDKVLAQDARLGDPKDIEPFVRRLVEQSPLSRNPYEVSKTVFIPINQVAAGFPRRTHNCTAHELLNCGHTELHCFTCDKYKPDAEMFNDHRAELFRYMILALRSEKAVPRFPSNIDQAAITLKAQTIVELLNKAIPLLLGRHYQMDPGNIQLLHDELWSKAKVYWKLHGKTQPAPTFEEAREYLKKDRSGATALHDS